MKKQKKVMAQEHIKILLASGSPRRKEILEKAGYDLLVKVPKGAEFNITGKEYSDELVIKCASIKLENAVKEFGTSYKDYVIVACDTVVVNDDIIIGKPKDKNDAVAILKSLSGKKHFVVSAVCICMNGVVKSSVEKTFVYFRKLTDKEITDYLERCNPYDKAGSYGIQDPGFDFVEKIDGNLDNVIGFPMKTFENLLN